MKVKIQTLTGTSHDVEVEENWTIKQVKREIYQSGYTLSEVKILIGPDDSKLKELGVEEGKVLSILKYPDKTIRVVVKRGLQGTVASLQVPNTTTVGKLKQQLQEQQIVSFLPDEYNLKNNLSSTLLDNDAMPLHYFRVEDTCHLSVVKTNLVLRLENHKGQQAPLFISRNATVGDLKQRIVALSSVSSTPDLSVFVRPFLKPFTKLAVDDTRLGDVVNDKDTVWAIENKFCNPAPFFTFDLGLFEVVCGIELGDTVLSVKLRAQEQLGIYAGDVQVFGRVMKEQSGRFVCDEFNRYEEWPDEEKLLPAVQYKVNHANKFLNLKHKNIEQNKNEDDSERLKAAQNRRMEILAKTKARSSAQTKKTWTREARLTSAQEKKTTAIARVLEKTEVSAELHSEDAPPNIEFTKSASDTKTKIVVEPSEACTEAQKKD